MFSNIPQKLASPFGLFGDDAKLAFRTQPGGILRLAEHRSIRDTDAYWDQYVLLFDSASDAFSLISPHDIRHALLEAPENVATLIRVVSARLFNLVSDHTFPSPTNVGVASFATSLIKTSTGTSGRNTTKEVLNCLRVLQRVLPVVFEGESELNTVEREVLWKKEEAPDDGVVDDLQLDPQFVIEDEDEEGGEAEDFPREKVTETSKLKQKKMLPSLAERLFSCTMDLLFCCGFTIPQKIQVDHHKINYVIWEKGVGSTVDPGPSHAYDTNKIEVLRLLLVLLSRQIYVSHSLFLTNATPYPLHLVQSTPRRDVLTLLCSLLNTATQSSQPSGTSMGSMAGKLPYNHLVFKGEDPRMNLVGICFQILCVVSDFQSGSARDKDIVVGETVSSAPTAHTNAFRYFLAKLHRPADFTFIFEGILSVLEEQMAAINNMLPGSKKSVPHILETFVFFWKMIELNKKFRTYVLESEKATDVLAYILCYSIEIKDKPQQHGLCRALSYIVQTLSAERAFGLKLSSPVNVQLPAKWSGVGTAGDFMINAIYSIVATTSGTLTSLYPALIIALSNCAPYFSNLSIMASTRLIQLFNAFSNPSFLLSDEGHPRLLFFMLETFNGIITHHLPENPNLVYAILRAHKTFEDLGTFTLARGLREVRRVQLAKEELARKSSASAKGKARADVVGEEEEPHQEKARLLENENGLGLSDSIEQLSIEQQRQENHAPMSTTPTSTPPPMSPATGESPVVEPTPSSISEKARGKRKEDSRPSSFDRTGSLERIAAAGVGRNGFVPTQEWVTSWQQGLPLDTIMLALSELLPKIHDLQASLNKPNSGPAIIEFLRSATLQHVLPPLQPHVPRRFMWSDASIVWLTSLIWGEIYVRGMMPLGIWNGTNVRLFYVKHTQVQSRQITDAVSTVVGGLLGRNSDAQSGRSRTLRRLSSQISP